MVKCSCRNIFPHPRVKTCEVFLQEHCGKVVVSGANASRGYLWIFGNITAYVPLGAAYPIKLVYSALR